MATVIMPYATNTYHVVVHEAEEGGYWGEIIELPGCVSQGETIEEFRDNIREALGAILESDSDSPSIEVYREPIQIDKGFVRFVIQDSGEGVQAWDELNESVSSTA